MRNDTKRGRRRIGLAVMLGSTTWSTCAADSGALSDSGNAAIALPAFGIALLLVIALLAHAWRRPTRMSRKSRPAMPASAGTAAAPAQSMFSAPSSPDTQAASAQRLREMVADIDDAQGDEVSADFYDEVAAVLRAELDKNPRRRDLRFKLLEVYASAERRDLFAEQSRSYIEGLGGQPDAYWPRIVRMGRELAPESGLYTDDPPLTLPPPMPLRPRPAERRRYYEGVDPLILGKVQAQLQEAYAAQREDGEFWRAVQTLAGDLLAEPPPLQALPTLHAYLGGARIYISDRRHRSPDDAAVLGVIGQLVLARAMHKRRVVCGGLERGHALSVARVAQQLGMQCTVYLHEDELRDLAALAGLERLGIQLMTTRDSILGHGGQTQLQTLADSLDDPQHSLYICPLDEGPAPYPLIARDLQGLWGRQLRAQIASLIGGLPDAVLVSAADGMPAIGMLHPLLATPVALHCVEAHAHHALSSRERCAREHSWLRASERVQYSTVAPEISRFVARYGRPDEIGDLHLAGGEVFAELYRLARAMRPEQVLVAVIPPDAAASGGVALSANAA